MCLFTLYFYLPFAAQLLGGEIRGELRARVFVCLSVSGCERLIFNGAQTISNQTANLLLFYYCYLFFPTKLPRSLHKFITVLCQDLLDLVVFPKIHRN